MGTYYEEHKKNLLKAINEVKIKRDQSKIDFFFQKDLGLFSQLETSVCLHQLRYYQMEAIYVLDHILSIPDNKKEKKSLLETVDTQTSQKAPFLGFEMATGSGKTALMGASIYYLYKKHGIKNFLIIAPSSIDIYQKTIRNFTPGTFETIWSESIDVSFNLITGDNYQESMFYDNKKDINIFIFNIDKFGANATNSKKRWESSPWKDQNGTTISIQGFLKNKELAIITDESHHAQNTRSKNIISGFAPKVVLEYTATAVESSRNEEKKNQTIVYKYDIKRFLEDGHGKLIRAIGIANQTKKSKKDSVVADSEKIKIVTLILIHLVKKNALEKDSNGLKPISFIKVKNETKYTEKVYDYILNDLANDTDNISLIIEKVQNQDLEMTNLIKDLFKTQYKSNFNTLKKDIEKVAKTAIFYHGQSDKSVKRKFDQIRKNEVEIVVYMQKLDEGIDIPNIFSMAVINDNETEFKTSVKQIIGRGVRLNKNKREHDNSNDPLQTQTEKLHIICDQGASFEKVILEIQKEFGLNDKYFSSEDKRKTVTNKAKSSLLEGKYLPHIKADFKAKKDISLLDIINDIEKITTDFLEANCFNGENDGNKRFLKFHPASFFVEVDLFSDHKVFHQQIQNAGGSVSDLVLTEKQVKDIYTICQKNLLCLPETKRTYETFKSYILKFNEIGLKYYKIDDSDERLAINSFVSTFTFFYRNYVEKHYFDLEFKEIYADESWNLKNHFKDHQIIIPIDQVSNKTLIREKDSKKLIELIKAGYNFIGYKNSVYDYVQFDSLTEKQLIDYVDEVTQEKGKGLLPFWIRNDRNVHFTYGSHKYYPDFLMLYKDRLYVIEVKGEKFSNEKKNFLLKKLDSVPGDGTIKGFKGLLVFEDQVHEIPEMKSWEQFVERAEEVFESKQTGDGLITSVDDGLKFKKFVPAYHPNDAYRLFVKQHSKVKKAGWVEVPEGTYDQTVFAVQVKGSTLSPKYKQNQWMLMNSKFTPKDAVGSLVFIAHEVIDDYYDGNYTIRKLGIEKMDDGTIFGSYKVNLEPENKAFPAIELKGITDERQLEIIGIALK